MSNKDEALKLALDALSDFDYEKRLNAIKAVQEALAQPAQEPEAWMHPDGSLWLFGHGYDKSTFTIPLYATPPQRPWVGLTDDEIKAMDTGTISNASFYAGALWADAKLKEMNKP